MLDHRDGKIRHCSQCENVIQDNLTAISHGKRQDDDIYLEEDGVLDLEVEDVLEGDGTVVLLDVDDAT